MYITALVFLQCSCAVAVGESVMRYRNASEHPCDVPLLTVTVAYF
jgi:hypothetical protein